MIFAISLISTLFILLILFLLLEYRSRSRRALARRMRYYSGGMDTQEKPKESLLRNASWMFCAAAENC